MKRHRYKPQNGDVFYLQIPAGNYLFGRVIIGNGARGLGPMPMATLVYLYDWQSSTPMPDYTCLGPDRLLIAPIWTNRLVWTLGYFQHIENQPMDERVLLRQHCFLDTIRHRYVDVGGVTLRHRTEPCGSWGAVSYRWIDDHVSDALGMPRTA
jgi:hypothetical protein